MQETLVKTHLIIKDIHDEYHMNWCGKIFGTKPALNKEGLPIFSIIGSESRIEVSTIDMNHLERCAKLLTHPRGRSAISADKAYIYIKETNGNEKLLGILTHKRIKNFAPMYDKFNFA